jgi:type I restriction enzyme S subunit
VKSAWQTRKLGSVATLQRGFDLPAQERVSGEVPLVSSSGVSDTHCKSAVRGPGVVTGRSGSIGNVFFVEEDFWPLNTVLYVKDFHGNDPRFIFYLLKNFDLNRFASGSGVPTLNRNFVHDELVNVPTFPEQKHIAAILDEAFDGIATAKANAEKNLQNARALFESYLQSVFTQSGEGWVQEPIGSVCDIKHGFSFDGAEFSNWVSEGNPLIITPGNFTEDGKLLFSERNTKRFSGKPPAGFLFDVGDLVVVMTDLSSKMKILGKPAFVETDAVLHNQRIGRVVFSNDRIQKRFLYYFMMSERFLKNIKGSATGTMVKHTAPKRILSNLIPFPRDQKEQLAVISKFDALREETQRLESIYRQKLAALDALKKSLLHQAFSGQL